MTYEVVRTNSSTVARPVVPIYLDKVITVGSRKIKLFSTVRDEVAVTSENNNIEVQDLDVNREEAQAPKTTTMKLF